MPEPDDSSREAIDRLGERLESFEASRAAEPTPKVLGDASGEGFRMLGQILGGVLGGLGLGWLVDQLAGTRPFGLLGGLVIGLGFSIYAAVRTAAAASAKSEATPTSAPAAGDDDED